MGMNRPWTEEEKEHKRKMSKRFWDSPEAVELKKVRGKRLGEWNKTRFRPEEERRASGERLTKINKTREHSEEERKAISERIKRRHESGWKRPPMTDAEKEAVRNRMLGNNFGSNNVMSEELKERHRQRMLTDNPVHKFVKNIGPNKSEIKLDELIAPLGFVFVGNGQVWLPKGPSGSHRNPDWVYQSRKSKIAVLHHGEYWHDMRKSDDEAAMKDYEFWGWKVFIVWEKENKKSKHAELYVRIQNWLKDALGEKNDIADARVA